MPGKVPVKTITGQCRKKDKSRIGERHIGLYNQQVYLGGHQTGNASNKQVAVYEKLPAGFQDFQWLGQGFFNLIFADSL